MKDDMGRPWLFLRPAQLPLARCSQSHVVAHKLAVCGQAAPSDVFLQESDPPVPAFAYWKVPDLDPRRYGRIPAGPRGVRREYAVLRNIKFNEKESRVPLAPIPLPVGLQESFHEKYMISAACTLQKKLTASSSASTYASDGLPVAGSWPEVTGP